MKANGVDDDHSKDCTENLLFPHHEMEPRVQNYGLTCDHTIPANSDDGHSNIVVQGLIAGNQLEKFEEESESMQHTAITRYQKGPEVEAPMSFEGEEDLDVEFSDIIPCDCGEGSYGHINALVEWDWAPGFSCNCFRYGHGGYSERRVSWEMCVKADECKVDRVDS